MYSLIRNCIMHFKIIDTVGSKIIFNDHNWLTKYTLKKYLNYMHSKRAMNDLNIHASYKQDTDFCNCNLCA